MAESARGIGARHGIVFGPGFRKEFGKTMKSLLVTGTFFFLLTHTVHSAEEKQAKVVNGVKEGDLATVTLTPSAEKRLAIKTEPIEEKSVLSSRLYGGELVLVDPAPEGGQSVFSLLPQMTSAERLRIAEEQVAADGILEAANVELAASEVVANRANELLRQKVGSARTVDDANARLEHAKSALGAASAKRDLLGPPLLAARAPEKLWVRVPVYVGDLDRIAREKDATIGRLDGRPSDDSRAGKPVTAPPSTNPAASTVDLFYAIDNPGRKLLPGQRVGVTLSLKTESENLVAPHAAILYDINGGSWVYQSLGNHVYTFVRLQISRVVGDRAVLVSGPKPGALVVTDGAAELFGTEFGVGK